MKTKEDWKTKRASTSSVHFMPEELYHYLLQCLLVRLGQNHGSVTITKDELSEASANWLVSTKPVPGESPTFTFYVEPKPVTNH